MGSGSWSTASYCSYSEDMGRGWDSARNTYKASYSNVSQAYKTYELDESLDPKDVVRECCDSKEHPNSFPIILALDVTGSMGSTALEVQKKLNPIMTEIYENIEDAEIAVMAIGDLAYDDAPIQMSQFESDIRIAENLDKVYFEGGGGGNDYESYTAAWYMGVNHAKLDCWKHGKKGVIITMGDEPINPYLPVKDLKRSVGGTSKQLNENVNTADLYEEASKKYDIYHICVQSKSYPDQTRQKETFVKKIGAQNVFVSDVDGIQKTIMNIVKDAAERNKSGPGLIVESSKTKVDENGEISW